MKRDRTDSTLVKKNKNQNNGNEKVKPAMKRSNSDMINKKTENTFSKKTNINQKNGNEKVKPAMNRSNSNITQQKRSQNRTVKNLDETQSENSETIISEVDTTDQSIITSDPFSKNALSKNLLDSLMTNNYQYMTYIQSQAIPLALQHKDIVAKAKTGTGKTLAFLVPIIEHISKLPTSDKLENNILALILSPIRELALQIYNVGNSLLKKQDMIKLSLIVGGKKMNDKVQLNHILVATPKILAATIKQNPKLLMKVKILVLDEADRLLDPGFFPTTKEIIDSAPPVELRQTLLFSATIPNNLKKLIDPLLKQDKINLDTIEKMEPLVNSVENKMIISSMDKILPQLALLLFELTKYPDYKILVFFPTGRATKLFTLLYQSFFPEILEIYGRKKQNKRFKVSDQFRNNSKVIMFSTDVSGRGLDYPDVTHTIQFTLPQHAEDFIHRIGRTGRNGKIGTGILIISDWEKNNLFQNVFKKLPEPKIIDCYPENELYFDINKKIIITANTLDEKTHQGAWVSMLHSFINFGKKADKAQVVQALAPLFTTAMGRSGILEISKRKAQQMKIAGVPGVIIK